MPDRKDVSLSHRILSWPMKNILNKVWEEPSHVFIISQDIQWFQIVHVFDQPEKHQLQLIQPDLPYTY